MANNFHKQLKDTYLQINETKESPSRIHTKQQKPTETPQIATKGNQSKAFESNKKQCVKRQYLQQNNKIIG